MTYDRVFQDKDGQWYHWDETEAGKYGPYATEEIARQKLDEYARWLDNQWPPEDPEMEET